VKHIAIDLGGRESQICIRDADGTIVREGKHPTDRLEEVLKGLETSRVIIETSAEAFAVADGALRLGHEARVVPSALSRVLGVGARRTKTDERDARALSKASIQLEKDLPSVHVPSKLARERRSLCTAREALVSARTQLINSVRGYLRTQLVRVVSGKTETFPRRVRQRLENRPEGLPAMIERLLLVIESLNEQIAASDRELAGIAKQDAICRRLMSMPGVGPVTSVRFSSALDQIDRFQNAHKVEAYLGLTPGEDSSSERERKLGITKAGPTKLRWALVQAAWSFWRTRPNDPNVLWAKQIAKRASNPVAIVALARKMTGILYAMWRDGTSYDPNQGRRRS
jgi:transposase